MAPVSRVRLVPHDVEWASEFERIAARLRGLLGNAAPRIDHIGSTAVPGLVAKNIIDLQVTVPSLQGVAAVLASAGFVQWPDVQRDHVPPGLAGSHDDWSKILLTEPRGERRTNVHVRVAGKPNQRYALLFRDYLRAHPATAQAYGELKRRLAASLANPKDYPEVKDPAVDLVYFAAEDWALQVGWEPGPPDA